MWCKIGNLMWSVLKSGCIKKKKQILILKQTENFAWTNANAL